MRKRIRPARAFQPSNGNLEHRNSASALVVGDIGLVSTVGEVSEARMTPLPQPGPSGQVVRAVVSGLPDATPLAKTGGSGLIATSLPVALISAPNPGASSGAATGVSNPIWIPPQNQIYIDTTNTSPPNTSNGTAGGKTYGGGGSSVAPSSSNGGDSSNGSMAPAAGSQGGQSNYIPSPVALNSGQTGPTPQAGSIRPLSLAPQNPATDQGQASGTEKVGSSGNDSFPVNGATLSDPATSPARVQTFLAVTGDATRPQAELRRAVTPRLQLDSISLPGKSPLQSEVSTLKTALPNLPSITSLAGGSRGTGSFTTMPTILRSPEELKKLAYSMLARAETGLGSLSSGLRFSQPSASTSGPIADFEASPQGGGSGGGYNSGSGSGGGSGSGSGSGSGGGSGSGSGSGSVLAPANFTISITQGSTSETETCSVVPNSDGTFTYDDDITSSGGSGSNSETTDFHLDLAATASGISIAVDATDDDSYSDTGTLAGASDSGSWTDSGTDSFDGHASITLSGSGASSGSYSLKINDQDKFSVSDGGNLGGGLGFTWSDVGKDSSVYNDSGTMGGDGTIADTHNENDTSNQTWTTTAAGGGLSANATSTETLGYQDVGSPSSGPQGGTTETVTQTDVGSDSSNFSDSGSIGGASFSVSDVESDDYNDSDVNTDVVQSGTSADTDNQSQSGDSSDHFNLSLSGVDDSSGSGYGSGSGSGSSSGSGQTPPPTNDSITIKNDTTSNYHDTSNMAPGAGGQPVDNVDDYTEETWDSSESGTDPSGPFSVTGDGNFSVEITGYVTPAGFTETGDTETSSPPDGVVTGSPPSGGIPLESDVSYLSELAYMEPGMVAGEASGAFAADSSTQTSPAPDDGNSDDPITVSLSSNSGDLAGVMIVLTITMTGGPDSITGAEIEAAVTGGPEAVLKLLTGLEEAGVGTEYVAAIENQLAQRITQTLLQGAGTAGHEAAVAASRSILSKLVTNTAGKFVRFSTKQLTAKFSGQTGALNNLFGTGKIPIVAKATGDKAAALAQRALQALQNGTVKVPPGITREAAEAYLEVARRAIAEGVDIVGSQAARAQLLDWLLSSGLL